MGAALAKGEIHMRAILSGVFAAILTVLATPALAQEGPTPAQTALAAELHPRQGVVDLAAAKIRLNLGSDYDFLDAAEAKRVLVEGWGNPPTVAEGVLGMIFPHGKTFLDRDVWGAVITYEETFYVSDKEVAKSDYDKLLTDMRTGEDTANAERDKAGFAPVHLVGWAEPPSYDKAHHNLIWARDIRFGDAGGVDTLNYDVRHLGRRGVLSLNIVAEMPQLSEIRQAAHGLAATAEFNAGERYADYQTGDKTAGYGLVGLVAAGAGLLAAKKLGLIAVILLFAKKGFVVILAAGAAIARWGRGLLGRKAPAPAPIADRRSPRRMSWTMPRRPPRQPNPWRTSRMGRKG
jgi:uncharacterized membrane-anchored protein